MVQRGDMINQDDIIDLLAIDLLGIIPEDDNVIISTNQGIPIVLNDKSLAGTALRNISRRVMGEDIPLLNLTNKKGFFSKLFSGGGS